METSAINNIHEINHSFRVEMIVPVIAIHHNVHFLDNDNNDDVKTADGVTCKVISKQEEHICRLEKDIQRLYGCTAWEFMQRWFKVFPNMSSMWFVKLLLEKKKLKEEKDENE